MGLSFINSSKIYPTRIGGGGHHLFWWETPPDFFLSFNLWLFLRGEDLCGVYPPFIQLTTQETLTPGRQQNRLWKLIEIDNDTSGKILRLVDEGVRIRIFGGRHDSGYLQQFKETLSEADLSEGSDAGDHVLDGELIAADED